MKKHYRHENDCLNCGTTLQGRFCHVCGQENLQIKESFGHVMNHAISDYFHFDHQFFHTLKPLLFKPGLLTNEYMAGKRAQYLHPIKMYIFISVVYFLLLFQGGQELVNVQDDNGKPVKVEQLIDSVNKDSGVIATKKKVSTEKLKFGPVTITNTGDDIKKRHSVMTTTTGDTSFAQYNFNQNKLSPDKRDGFFTGLLNKKILTYNQKYGERGYEVFMEEFKHNIPKMMFILLPVFALMLSITFRKNHKFYVEHLIYSFHLHCFAFLILAVDLIFEKIIPAGWHVTDLINFISGLYILWYIYKSLRAVYHRSAIRTITKIIGMDLAYSLSFLFCLALVLIITTLTAA